MRKSDANEFVAKKVRFCGTTLSLSPISSGHYIRHCLDIVWNFRENTFRRQSAKSRKKLHQKHYSSVLLREQCSDTDKQTTAGQVQSTPHVVQSNVTRNKVTHMLCVVFVLATKELHNSGSSIQSPPAITNSSHIGSSSKISENIQPMLIQK